MNQPKLLVLGDSPTVSTGFANVVRNLCQRWQPSFPAGIDIWGINHAGWPHNYPYKIYPAGFHEWTSGKKLSEFLNLLGAEEYTHLFILCDCHQLAISNFPKLLRQVCDAKKVSATHYYPVDAPLERKWLELVAICDHAVTYTEYGRKETVRVRPGLNPHVIPHGVDTTMFYPLETRDTIREKRFGKWLKPDDFLIVNVNRNEKRKAPHHSLQILKRLKDMGVERVKLLLHMPKEAAYEGTDLELVGEQLGLPHTINWAHSDKFFVNSNAQVTEVGLNEIYNAADLVLSTSYGEGWGLSFSEGASTGCRIALPDHTACSEIADGFEKRGQTGQIVKLPLSNQSIVNMLDNSRVRYPVDIEKSAQIIANIIKNERVPTGANTSGGRYILNDAVKEWLSWDRAANEFLKIML